MKDGSGFVKSVLMALAILVVAVFAFVGYNSYSTRRHPSSDVVTQDDSTDRGSNLVQGGSSATGASRQSQSQSGSEITESGAASAAGLVPPPTDSIQPDPPNGMTFGGSGHYQLYRQGNLTWRLNTDNGQTCIIFATEEEWKKPQVSRAGCRGK